MRCWRSAGPLLSAAFLLRCGQPGQPVSIVVAHLDTGYNVAREWWTSWSSVVSAEPGAGSHCSLAHWNSCSTYETLGEIMSQRSSRRLLAIMAIAVAQLVRVNFLSADDQREQADQILSETGVAGGIIVYLGCGEGKLTAALRAGEGFTVHGLDADRDNVAAAREFIANNGDYGPVSIDHFSSSRLPYGNDLINLVIDEAGTVARDEVLRVIAPGGVLYSLRDGQWHKSIKPRPSDIDDWSHFLHDAGNNAVAADDQVGPPRSLRWIAPPLWLRSHETPSGIQAMVSAGGRLFYFFDEGLIGITDQRLPERWSLICRDAFNGRELWRQSLGAWGWPEWAGEKFSADDWVNIRGGRTVVPPDNQRLIVASTDRLFTTLTYNGPLSILDAASGELLHTVPETEPVREIIASDGLVVTHSRTEMSDRDKRRGLEDRSLSTLTAVRAESGQVAWQIQSDPLQPVFLAVNEGRVIYLTARELVARDLSTGHLLWGVDSPKSPKNLVAHSGIVLLYANGSLHSIDGRTGEQLWRHDVPAASGSGGSDLFVSNGLAWRGMVPIDGDSQPIKKSTDAMVLGFDLRTGEEQERIVVRGLLSPKHHHRCYRNKATDRYIIAGMEGAEFIDLRNDNHGQNNFVRGACKQGIMPCNGMIYIPADQCFCQPGAKLLGFAAVGTEVESVHVEMDQRLERGPAWGITSSEPSVAGPDDWPTFRHDPARHGSTPSAVPADVVPLWRTDIGGRLTAPVSVGGRVYVAARDAHTVHALDSASGNAIWNFATGGRIDSPPTFHDGTLLFGSADGYVYCVRADNGQLMWRFLAAPEDRRIGYFDQIESAWPVHGSILVRNGIAYATAGRSTYLDGGIRVYGLDPATGYVVHQTTLSGPHRTVGEDRDLGFFIEGANSDVLVSEGDHLYMRQKKLTLELEQVDVPILSSKGAQDVGLHMFSTSGLLDGSGYNRAFWMYSKRWPGFQLANQAPKSGQLLVADDQRTFGIKVFTRRNVHSPMYFPGNEGFLVVADKNSTEPQIVGEPGARPAVEWLPQSHIPRDGDWGVNSPAFGADKMVGYTRAELPLWAKWVKIRACAMVKAGKILFLAGPPDTFDASDPYASFDGREGARLAALATTDGAVLNEIDLESPPVFDGLIAAQGKLFISLEDGSLTCLSEATE